MRPDAVTRYQLPAIRAAAEDVDVSTLDASHILPNAGPPIWRGVWYPNVGLESQR